MTLNAMHNIYPRISEAVQEAFSQFRIRTVEIDQSEVMARIYACEDPDSLFFVSVPSFILSRYAEDPHILFRPLIDTELDVMVARNSSLAERSSFDWSDFKTINLILRRDNGMIDLLTRKRVITADAFPESGWSWTSDSEHLKKALMRNDLATFSTSFLSRYPDDPDFTHVPLRNPIKTPVGFIGREGFEPSPQAKELRSFVESYISLSYPDALFKEGETVAKRWRAHFSRKAD